MTDVIRFLVSEDEKRRIEDEAGKVGLTVSAFLRLLFRQYNDGIRFEKKPTNGSSVTTRADT